jgi:hypothetical protein
MRKLRRLWARTVLQAHGICPDHLVKMQTHSSYCGDSWTSCDMCDKDAHNAIAASIHAEKAEDAHLIARYGVYAQ